MSVVRMTGFEVVVGLLGKTAARLTSVHCHIAHQILLHCTTWTTSQC